MDELVGWLRGVLADDEKAAKATRPADLDETTGTWLSYEHPPGRFDEPGLKVAMVGCVEVQDEVEWGVATVGQWDGAEAVAVHIARYDPAQVLADIEAKKTVLDLHDHSGVRWTGFPRADRQESYCVHDQQAAPCPTVLALASAYRNRPGWNPEWEA